MHGVFPPGTWCSHVHGDSANEQSPGNEYIPLPFSASSWVVIVSTVSEWSASEERLPLRTKRCFGGLCPLHLQDVTSLGTVSYHSKVLKRKPPNVDDSTCVSHTASPCGTILPVWINLSHVQTTGVSFIHVESKGSTSQNAWWERKSHSRDSDL